MGQISTVIKNEIVDNMRETMTTNPIKINVKSKEEIKHEKNNEKNKESKFNDKS